MSVMDSWMSASRYSDNEESDEEKPRDAEALPRLQDKEKMVPPAFKAVKFDWRPPRDSKILHMDVASFLLLIALDNGTAVCWDVSNDTATDIAVARRGEMMHKVFIDPLGNHGLISMHNGNVFYVHFMRNVDKDVPNKVIVSKAIPLSKVKGFVINSVAWNTTDSNEISTKRILLGTTKGQIWETVIEAEKDKYCKKLYDLANEAERDLAPPSICGLRFEIFPNSGSSDGSAKYYVAVATPTRLYQFIGGPSFEAMFARYAANPPSFIELPGDLDFSELRFFSKNHVVNISSASEACAWLTGAGIYYGNLSYSSQDIGDRVFDNGKMLQFPSFPEDARVQRGAPAPRPISVVLREFHFLLLTSRRLVSINRLSEEVNVIDTFDPARHGQMIGMCIDADKDTCWMYSNQGIYEIEMDNEDRDVWKLYLNQGKYAQCLEYCTTDEQRELVHRAQADNYFAKNMFSEAASAYAKTSRSFEEIALKFIGQSQLSAETPKDKAAAQHADSARKALKEYLLSKFLDLPQEEITQQMMLATWLTEIYLDNLNSLAPSSGFEPAVFAPVAGQSQSSAPAAVKAYSDAYKAELREFKDFIKDNFDCLDKRITLDLMASHGMPDMLLFYADISSDFETVLNLHVQRKEFRAALKVLNEHPRPSSIASLYYKFCPVLMKELPVETVDMLIKIQTLSPTQIMPALIAYESNLPPHFVGKNQAIRYLEHCINVKGNQEPAIHNYLVSLLAKLPLEQPVVDFINTWVKPLRKPLYDYRYALRVCHQERKDKACVAIYCAMGLFEEAVKLALKCEIATAKQVVEKAELYTEEADRKRLWLLIGRKLIEEGQEFSKIMALLKEKGCQLKLEDILPYFPDFVKIGEFKEEICRSLEAYNHTIEQLKEDMEEFTKSAKLIRKDIAELRARSGRVSSRQKCDLCREPVLTRQFLLFPCTHAFHLDCACKALLKYLDKDPQLKAEVIGAFDPSEDALMRRNREDKLLEARAACECCLCGQMMIDSVQEPFILLPEESAEAKTWQIFHD